MGRHLPESEKKKFMPNNASSETWGTLIIVAGRSVQPLCNTPVIHRSIFQPL
jgi:hypothetical protein